MQPVEIINTNNSNVFKVRIFYFQTLMHMHTAGIGEHYRGGHYTLYESSKTHNMNTLVFVFSRGNKTGSMQKFDLINSELT